VLFFLVVFSWASKKNPLRRQSTSALTPIRAPAHYATASRWAMSLRDRLQKLQGQRGLQPASTLEPPLPSVTERMARHGRASARMSEQEVAQALGGEVVSTGLIVVDRTFPMNFVHGDTTLDEVLTAPLPLLGDYNSTPTDLLFLDTETTGLAGGTGTLPFLLGLSRVEGDALHVRQFFLTGFKGEKALLNEALPWYRHAAHLVTFNGKTFDLPLLITRYRLARLRDPFIQLGHLDLLYPTRTAFANHWPDCRLQTAERRLLNFHRQDDLPGHLVPQVWFDFVRAGHFKQVPGILEHNRWDLVSLTTLAARMAALFARSDHPEADVLAIARSFRRKGEEEQAHAHLRDRRQDLSAGGLLELAALHRARGEWDAAVEIWNRLAADNCSEAIERLAKYHEHVAKNPVTALAFAQRLAGSRPEAEVQKRVSRLIRKS
jgi:uncharacterized protein YprB with RNaseH-like and TPR domain